MWKRILLTAGVVLPTVLVMTAFSEEACRTAATADLINTKGESVGQATFTETPHGVLIHASAKGLPAGWHAFHIHEKGACTPPDFKSAGGHFNPGVHTHGYESPTGSHAGDLPNVSVDEHGDLDIEFLADKVTLGKAENSLFDEDGSALVIHAGKDDYTTDPAGNAGDRIVCGVIK